MKFNIVIKQNLLYKSLANIDNTFNIIKKSDI